MKLKKQTKQAETIINKMFKKFKINENGFISDEKIQKVKNYIFFECTKVDVSPAYIFRVLKIVEV